MTQEAGEVGNPNGGEPFITVQTVYSPDVVVIQPGWTVTGAGITATTTVTSVTETSPGIWEIVTDTEETNPFLYDEVYTFTETTVSGYTFDGSGLQFPDATVQTTAYVPEDNLVKVSDEWSVTTGTNTYSFTVPADGTYIMWVKGNIPNGIITWNATVSVSNTNVPAIGTQYAWNYTGGGSPIALTSLPDQIRGSAGTISTDATYAGTTSNRFDFGISNTSESTQTIYYGYTKIS